MTYDEKKKEFLARAKAKALIKMITILRESKCLNGKLL